MKISLSEYFLKPILLPFTLISLLGIVAYFLINTFIQGY